MYSREQYYHKCYTENKELIDRVDNPEAYRVKGHYRNQIVYIDTDNRRGYDKNGRVIIQFVH